MIVVVANIEIDRTKRDACVAASVPIQKATRDDEPGCMAYCFGPDPVESNRLQVYELWTDEASLAAHFLHPNYHAMRKMFNDFGPIKAVSRKFLTTLDEPVYDATFTPRADFFTAKDPGATV